MHEDGEYDSGITDKEPIPTEELIAKVNGSLKDGIPFDKAFTDKEMKGLSYTAAGNPDLYESERFKAIARSVYNNIKPSKEKKDAPPWNDFSNSLKSEWNASVAEIQQNALELLSSPDMETIKTELWQEVEERFSEGSESVTTIEPKRPQVDAVLADADIEGEDVIPAVNEKEFWDEYRRIMNASPLKKTTVALEVIPTIENDGIVGLEFAHPRQPGVLECNDNNSSVLPRVVIIDATDPRGNFMGGKSNRTAGKGDKSHYISARGFVNPRDVPLIDISNRCTFGNGSGGELVMSVPVKSDRYDKTVYVSYLVTDAKFIISNEVDDRQVPKTSSSSGVY